MFRTKTIRVFRTGTTPITQLRVKLIGNIDSQEEHSKRLCFTVLMERSSELERLSRRSTTVDVLLYRCATCSGMASQFEALIELHAMLEHGDADKNRDWTARHIPSIPKHLVVPPGRWDRIGRGIYEETLQFLAQRAAAACSQLGSAAAQRLLEWLHGSESQYLADITDRNSSPLDCLIEQVNTRDILFAVGLKLRCLEDAGFRSVLKSDEEKIIDILRDIIDNDKDAMLEMRDEKAVDFLDILDTIICDDRAAGIIPFQGLKPITVGTRKRLYRTAVRLSQASQQFTRRIHLSNVHVPPTSSVAFGCFGVVYKGQYQNKHVAFKLLHDQSRQAKHSDGQRYPRAFCKEAAILRYLKHPHVCSLIGISEFVLDGSSKVGLVTPWMSNGNVIAFIENIEGGWQKSIVMNLMHEIIAGLHYLHKMGVIHADLHPANILVDDKEHVQLVDFGMANFSNSTLSSAGSVAPGAMCYMAPEILALWESNATHLPSRHTEASDIYSFGQVCWHLYTGLKPPHATKIIRGEHPDRSDSMRKIPDHLWGCMTACWSFEAAKRPSTVEIDRMLDANAQERRTRTMSQLIPHGGGSRIYTNPLRRRQTSSATRKDCAYLEIPPMPTVAASGVAEQSLTMSQLFPYGPGYGNYTETPLGLLQASSASREDGTYVEIPPIPEVAASGVAERSVTMSQLFPYSPGYGNYTETPLGLSQASTAPGEDGTYVETPPIPTVVASGAARRSPFEELVDFLTQLPMEEYSIDPPETKPSRRPSFKVKYRKANEEARWAAEMGAELRRTKVFIDQIGKDAVRWARSMTDMMDDLRLWSDTLGFAMGTEHFPGLVNFIDTVRKVTYLCEECERRIERELLVQLKRLSDSMNKPKRQLNAMRTSPPMQILSFSSRSSKAHVRAQLLAEMPKYLELLDMGIQVSLSMLQRLQRMLYQRINEFWSEYWELTRFEQEDQGLGSFREIVTIWRIRMSDNYVVEGWMDLVKRLRLLVIPHSASLSPQKRAKML